MHFGEKLYSARMAGIQLGLCAALFGASILVQAGEIATNLEEPGATGSYSGIGNLRGWAVSSVGIDYVELFIDGVLQTNIPSGGTRNDIGAAFPDFPDSSESGFSMAFAYLKLSDGAHTIKIRVVDNDAEVKTITRTFTTVNFGSKFISNPDAVDGSGAQVFTTANSIALGGLVVDGASYNVVLKWSRATQGLVFSGIAPVMSGECENVPLVASGSRVMSDFSGTSGGLPVSGFIDTRYIAVSEIGATTDTTNETTSGGVKVTTESMTVQKYFIKDNFLNLEEVNVDSEAKVFNSVVKNSVKVVNNPALLGGPAKVFCAGQKWVSPSVQQTVNVNGDVTVGLSPSHTGTVFSVDESVTTPAGTFKTIMLEKVFGDGARAEEWIDKVTGVSVQQKDYDAANTLVNTNKATSVE